MGVVLGIVGLLVMGVIIWWDWENPDKQSVSIGELDRKTTRLNNDRKSQQIATLNEKIRKLNEENPGRLFYRAGPRIKEYTQEEIARINFTKAEYERLNAPYASHQRHYFIIEGALVKADEHRIAGYKYEEKMRYINRSGVGIHARFDHISMKLIDTISNEEIPFDPDAYVLTGE